MRKLREVMRLRFELTSGLPADRAQLRDRGEHGMQVPETRRGGGPDLAAAGWLGRCKGGCGVVPPIRAPGARTAPGPLAAGLRLDP